MEVGEFAFPIDPVENMLGSGFRGQGSGFEKRFSRIVISSEVEKSLSYAVKQSICHTPETGNLFFPHMCRNRFHEPRSLKAETELHLSPSKEGERPKG